MTVLVLGGTAEARAVAAGLVTAGHDVVTSLAGRVREPALPAGRLRVGGFGGVDGLSGFLEAHDITAVIDATHPFAALIGANAAAAATRTGVALLRLERPGWADHPRATTWSWVADTEGARGAADGYARPFLTTGRQSLDAFLPWADRTVLLRVVDPPTFAVPEPWTVLTARGPYAYADERRLMTDHRTDVLLTKDSGGEHTAAKLDAAADLGVAVVIIARPRRPADIPTVATVADALAWLG